MKVLHFIGFLFFLCVCYSCTKDELVQSDEEVAKVNQSQKKKSSEPDTWMAGIEITDLFGSSIYSLMEDVKTNRFAAVGVYVKYKSNPDKPFCWELAMDPLTDNGWSLYVEEYVKRLYLVYNQKIATEDDRIDVPVFYEEREPMWAKCTFYKQGAFQITPFDGMVLKIVLGFDKASAGCGFVTTYESLDLDLSYYNSLRVFNLLQNEDLELYPKR